MIRKTLLAVLLSLASAVCLAQTFNAAASVSGVWALYGEPFTITQYDMAFDPGAFKAHQESDVYEFTHIPGYFQMITVGGVTRIWANTNQNWCASATGCTFIGTFDKLEETLVTIPKTATVTESQVMRVGGTARGTFTDASGTVYGHVRARLYFETNPAVNPDFSEPVNQAPGELIIILQP
jgi:hypothetical protein